MEGFTPESLVVSNLSSHAGTSKDAAYLQGNGPQSRNKAANVLMAVVFDRVRPASWSCYVSRTPAMRWRHPFQDRNHEGKKHLGALVLIGVNALAYFDI